MYNNSGTYKYDYFIKDHVGNVRVAFNASASGTAQTIQADDYYPHGNTFNSVTPSGRNNYLFNGMEFQPEHNLNTFDFHARMYDPQIGRTHQQDPMAGLYASLSPYSFLANNPIRYTDPTGMYIDDGFGGGGGGWNSPAWGNNNKNGEGLDGLMYDWNTGQYMFDGDWVSSSFAMGYVGKYKMHASSNIRWSESKGEVGYWQKIMDGKIGKSKGTDLGEIEIGQKWIGLDLGANLGGATKKAGFFGDVTFGLISVGSFGASVNNEMKAYIAMKGNLEMFRELKSIRSLSPIYRQTRQAELLSQLARGSKTVEALKLASQRLAFVGLLTGGIEATYKGTAEAWGWVGADAAMTVVGMTGWGAPISGIYFAGRFIQGLIEMKQQK